MRVFASIAVLLLCAAGRAAADLSEYFGFKDIEVVKLNWQVGGLDIRDFNSDGLNDMVLVNNHESKIELLLQRESSQPPAETDPEDINALEDAGRYLRQSVMVTVKVVALTCGDLNGDGRVDLAYFGQPQGLYLLVQKQVDEDGRITFDQRQKIRVDDDLTAITCLEAGDLNGDGRTDLLVGGRQDMHVLYQDDKGRLEAPVRFPTTSTIRGAWIRDMDGDGCNDLLLIVDDKERPMLIRFGRADGSLGPQVEYPLQRPVSLSLQNLDDRPGQELLTVEQTTGRLSGYRLQKEEAAGSDEPTLLLYPLEDAEGRRQRDLVIGDFDGDGMIDVVVSYPEAAEIAFHRQLPEVGLDRPVRFPAYTDIASLQATDVDGDGCVELLLVSGKEQVAGISRYQGGRFTYPKALSLPDAPVAAWISDIDGNGKPDLLAVLRNSDRKYRLLVRFDGIDSETTVETELAKLTSDPDGLRAVDLNGDGRKEILVFQKYEGPLLVHHKEDRVLAAADPTESQAGLMKQATLQTVFIDESDRSTGLLTCQQNFARRMVLNDAGQWRIEDQYNARSRDDAIAAVAAFDLTGDGSDEILLLDGKRGTLQMLAASEDGTYRFDRQMEVQTWDAVPHLKMAWAPLTAESARSILLFDGAKFALLAPGEAKANLRPTKLFDYETTIKDGTYSMVKAGDLNRDGVPDAVVLENARKHLEILTLRPTSTGCEPMQALAFRIFEEKHYEGEAAVSGREPREMRIADVTGDGADDLILVIHDRVIVYPQDWQKK